IKIDDSGNVFWIGGWDGPSGTNTGLFRNLDLLVQQGVTQLPGGITMPQFSSSAVAGSFGVSDDGQNVIFSTTDALYQVGVPEPVCGSLLLVPLLARRRSGRRKPD